MKSSTISCSLSFDRERLFLLMYCFMCYEDVHYPIHLLIVMIFHGLPI
jgi:hypothetical protein